jgi:hypothetical protein
MVITKKEDHQMKTSELEGALGYFGEMELGVDPYVFFA